MTILKETQPMTLPAMTISDGKVDERPDRESDDRASEDPWIDDFIERLNFAIEDLVRK
jgi:hypothetical protein